MDLCGICEHIDFDAVGLREAGDFEYDPFELGNVDLQDVINRAMHCPFCHRITKFFQKWVAKKYGGVDRISLIGAYINYDFETITPIEKDGTDWNSHLHPTTPVLFRLNVNFTVRDPEHDRFTGPSFTLQKCATENLDVASLLQMPQENIWLEHEEPYLGRIRPLRVDYRLLRRWTTYCLASHQGTCGTHLKGNKPLEIRLIDVRNKCIVERHDVDWVCLSYLWGDDQSFTLKQDKLAIAHMPGFIEREDIPQTIRDAMIVTAAIGESYLWVDRFCIVQDDLLDKVRFVPQMDMIYGFSKLTIVDAASSNPQGGLAGVQDGSRGEIQDPFYIEGVKLVQVLDPINTEHIAYASESEWNDRGWTLQEGILAPRLLIFTTEQVYWQCAEASWCEDGFWECPNAPTIYRHFLNDSFRKMWSEDNNTAEEKYRILVQNYTRRNLKYEGDILYAFEGILGAFKRCFDFDFIWGLPSKYLGAALTWPLSPKGQQIPRRRNATCEPSRSQGFQMCFPSWSWLGWFGDVDFEECFGLLTSKHAGLIFYRLSSNCEPKMVQQISDFVETYETRQHWHPERGEHEPSNPLWREDCQTVISTSDVPRVVSARNLWAICIGFWSSCVHVTVQYLHSGRDRGFEIHRSQPKVMHNDVELKLIWGHVPLYPHDLDGEPARLVIIGRHTSCTMRKKEELVAIVAKKETDEGVTYREGLVYINESDWNNLSGRIWGKVFLA
ncbi:hypothetical protein RBB50_008674 [Rhinocladiella similis]